MPNNHSKRLLHLKLDVHVSSTSLLIRYLMVFFIVIICRQNYPEMNGAQYKVDYSSSNGAVDVSTQAIKHQMSYREYKTHIK